MTLYTIGFSKKNAETFFELLILNGIKRLIDIRLNNKSQLAGFTKSGDLKYFLRKIANMEYIYMPMFAPTKELLKKYQEKQVGWKEYEGQYEKILDERNVLDNIDYSIFDNAVLLCSESTSECCHRRLLAEYLANSNSNIKIKHL
jgi:uncharacterized protein (DUF488 family)